MPSSNTRCSLFFWNKKFVILTYEFFHALKWLSILHTGWLLFSTEMAVNEVWSRENKDCPLKMTLNKSGFKQFGTGYIDVVDNVVVSHT